MAADPQRAAGSAGCQRGVAVPVLGVGRSAPGRVVACPAGTDGQAGAAVDPGRQAQPSPAAVASGLPVVVDGCRTAGHYAVAALQMAVPGRGGIRRGGPVAAERAGAGASAVERPAVGVRGRRVGGREWRSDRRTARPVQRTADRGGGPPACRMAVGVGGRQAAPVVSVPGGLGKPAAQGTPARPAGDQPAKPVRGRAAGAGTAADGVPAPGAAVVVRREE